MEQVFISNNETVATNGFKITEDFNDINLPVKAEHQGGNTIFIIDIHCAFKQAEKLQQQGGIIIYRYLLKQFEKCQDKLKVVFYSPVPQDDLVKLKPENYVLKLLPFVECKYEEGQFERELTQIITDNKFPQFNNASENLLSGWALANKEKIEKGHEPEKINTNGKKILFIDDQQSEWKEVFLSNIFNVSDLILLNGINNQQDYRNKIENNWQGFVDSIKTVVNNNDISLVLSDFYLKENHETTEWKDIPKIKSISGFQLFDELRKDFPATPYIFHTSSNKASIYKFLDTNGVDDWIVKDIRKDSSKKQKLINFDVFKSCIEGFLCVATYDRMKEIWDEIKGINSIPTGKFWEKFYKEDTEKPILKSSWLAIRRVLNREVYFEKQLTGLTEHYSDSFTATSVCSNLCKVLEDLKFKNNNTSLASFLMELRHEASHISSYNDFTIGDAILYFKLLFRCLKEEITIYKYDNYFHKIKKKKIWVSHPYALFWLYVKYFNSVTNWQDLHIEQAILKKRTEQVFDKYKSEQEFKTLLSTDIKLKKLLEYGTDISKDIILNHNAKTNKFSIGNS